MYSAGMASFDTEDDFIGGYRTQESNRASKNHKKWLPFTNANKGYRPIHNNELDENATLSIALSTLEQSRDVERRNSNEAGQDEDEEEDELNAIKLGLGDFIFYSVLVGKAAKTDSVTLCLCIIAILTVSESRCTKEQKKKLTPSTFQGLSLTILILTLNRKALPALPISILLGCITYATAYYMTSPMIFTLSLQNISL